MTVMRANGIFFRFTELTTGKHARVVLLLQAVSWVLGLGLWLYSLGVIIRFYGWLAVFAVFLLQAVTPLAALILFFAGQWPEGAAIVTALIMTYVLRYGPVWLAARQPHKTRRNSDDVVDIEAVVKDIDD